MESELDVAFKRPCVRYLSESWYRSHIVRVAVAGNIEEIEEICAETKRLPLGNVKVFEGRAINLAKAGARSELMDAVQS